MAKRSVNVLIKARDEASRKFGVVALSAGVMGKALKGVASIAKTAFVTAFRVAKKAAIGLAAAFAYCTYAAIKQEAAEIELASSLKIAGEYSEELMQKLKAEATAIQDVTVFGDEYILTLMRMAKTQGVATDKLGETAKAAIALHAGFGGGKGKPEIFLRYYIDALRKTGSSLDSYVGKLRKAKTEEERQVVLQEALTYGWDAVTAKAESAGGALKQLKNKLGDIAESIAWPFLPGITSAAKAMKDWAIENEADIAYWAKKVHTAMVFVKDVFIDFITFMKEDWRAGISFVFSSFLKLLSATFESAVVMAIAGGKGIWLGIKKGIGLGKREKEIHKRAEQRYWRERTSPAMTAAQAAAYEAVPLRKRPFYQKVRKEIEAGIIRGETKSILGESLSVVTETFGNTLKTILEDMPAELRKKAQQSYLKMQKRLKEITKPAGRAMAGGEAGAPAAFSMAGDIVRNLALGVARKLAPLESRLLTFAPGTRFSYEQETAKNTKELLREQRIQNKLLREQIQEAKRSRSYQGERMDFAMTNFR